MTVDALCDEPVAVPVTLSPEGASGPLAELAACVADCGDPVVHVAARDEVHGVAVIYNIPVDEDRAPQATRDVWQRRERSDIDDAVAEWAAMLARVTEFRGARVVCGVVDGDAVGLPGWVSVQFFFPPDQLGFVRGFAETAREMRGVLTRTTFTW